ncbi:glycosyltransferase [Paenibacillus puldeungensis]|uniref:Glycosyltransferase n=1 Tax=Paenibacillus puldeungensis TaxID=696536 RepID=A0ABW3RSP3_9BACL
MRQFSPVMIQQQLYTRERSGIFRGTEGFDTVAASDGLDPIFIKKQLHPFCGYDAPAELTSRGIKEAASYPPAIHLFHAEGGETVLGRSVYQPVDFTGLRSAFLTHNYVIPSARLDEIVTDYGRYLEADFAEKYYPEIGRELPELENLPQMSERPQYQPSPLFGLPAGKLLDELKLGEQGFKRLLFAVMTAVGEGRKKVYVALDVPPEQISQYALALLKVLFACLPFELRRRIGFITYAKEPQSRKFIHLQFVERGSLRPGDREIEKEYVFDLASGRMPQDEVDEGRQPYLDFVWSRLGELESLKEFHRFADDMLSGREMQSRALLSVYHELCVFYQIEADRWDLYENHKLTVLRGLLSYLEPVGSADSIIRLNDIFLAAFDREFDRVKQQNIAELEVVECFRDYYRLDRRNYGPKLVNYLILAINNTLTEGNTELAYSLYALVESQPELSRAFFDTVLKHGELSTRLFEPYIQNKLAEAHEPKEVLNIVHGWAVAHSELMRNASFKECAATGLTEKLRKQQSLLPAVHMVLENIGKWKETDLLDSGMTLADSELVERLSLTAKGLLLDQLELDKLTRDQVVSAAFLGKADAFAGLQLEGRQRSLVAMLQVLYEWFTQRDPKEDIFRKLSPGDKKRVQELGRRWLQSSIEVAQFGRIVLAFQQEADHGPATYNQVLDYLQRYAHEKETIYEFMLWSQGQPWFLESRAIAPAYSSAILTYFEKHDRDAFKSKDYRNRYFGKAGAQLAKVFAGAQMELSSPLKRFLAQNGKKVRMTLLILASCLVVVAGVLVVLQQQGVFEPKAPVEATPPQAPASSPEPEVFVYADKVIGGDGKETTSLVFLFSGEDQCKAFVPSALTIESPGKSAQQFMNLKYKASCAVESNGTGNAGAPEGVNQGADDKKNATKTEGKQEASQSDKSGQSGNTKTDATDSADKTKATDTKNKTAADKAVTSDANKLGDASKPDKSASAKNDVTKDVYPRVIVSLGMKLDVPTGSVIKLADQQFTVITREEAESKLNPIEMPKN